MLGENNYIYSLNKGRGGLETNRKNTIKTIAVSLLIGVLSAAAGTAFSKSVELVTKIREQNGWLVYFLCLAGLLSVLVFKALKCEEMGTNQVIESASDKPKVTAKLAPAVFVGSVLSHLFGASVGREGAALQLGGGMAAFLNRVFKFDDDEGKIMFYSAMAGMFSSVFLMPITAVLFSLEVVCAFKIKPRAILPCILSSFAAYGLSRLLGSTPEKFTVTSIPEISAALVFKTMLLSLCAAAVGVGFCLLLKYGKILSKKLFKNAYLRIFVGGLLITTLTLLIGNSTYNGAGMHTIFSVFEGEQIGVFAFLLKMLFTVISVSAGFKGGEIVPSLFIGCALGFTLSMLLSLPVGFCAMICMVALFVSVTNCPLPTIALGFELFSGVGVGYVILAVIICFAVSGKIGLYSAQKRLPIKNIFAKSKSSTD